MIQELTQDGREKNVQCLDNGCRHTFKWINLLVLMIMILVVITITAASKDSTVVVLAESFWIPCLRIATIAHASTTGPMILYGVTFVIRRVETFLTKYTCRVDSTVDAVVDELTFLKDVATDGVLTKSVERVELFCQRTSV